MVRRNIRAWSKFLRRNVYLATLWKETVYRSRSKFLRWVGISVCQKPINWSAPTKHTGGQRWQWWWWWFCWKGFWFIGFKEAQEFNKGKESHEDALETNVFVVLHWSPLVKLSFGFKDPWTFLSDDVKQRNTICRREFYSDFHWALKLHFRSNQKETLCPFTLSLKHTNNMSRF